MASPSGAVILSPRWGWLLKSVVCYKYHRPAGALISIALQYANSQFLFFTMSEGDVSKK